jgi:hypothetical protein
VSFAVITLCVASQQVFIVVSVYFVMDSVQKLFGTSSYILKLVAPAPHIAKGRRTAVVSNCTQSQSHGISVLDDETSFC